MEGAYTGEEEPTHALPEELKAKLLEAKEWYDRREPEGVGYANLEAYVGEGANLLEDIVEIIEQTWGF